MSVSARDVQRIGELARLHLEDDELECLTLDLNAILRHVDSLRDLGSTKRPEDSSQIGSKLTPVSHEHVEGPDKLCEMPEDFAPEWKEGFFIVPAPPGVHPSGDQ